MSNELVVREDSNGISVLSLNRPEKLNALSYPMFKELLSHLLDLREDDSIGCVVLKGNGKCFSAGHDLGDLAEGEHPPSPGWNSEVLRTMETLPKPVIAAVHGHCFTGALEVALAADFIVASDNAKFADTHSKWALSPIWGMSQRLQRRVGEAKAKKLMFTAQLINSQEAYRIGLCEDVFDNDQFLDRVMAMAATIVANSPFSHAENKRLMSITDGLSMEAGLLVEVSANRGMGPDAQDRIAKFLTK